MHHTWITRYVVLVCGVGLFALGGVLSWYDYTASAIATYSFAVLCLFYVFLPGFKRFKAFGLEAELLEKKIEEADLLMSQLRALTFPMAEMLFTIVARMGRWDSMVPRGDRHRIMEDLEKQLTVIGVSARAIEDAKKDWHKFNVIDLARPVFMAAHKQITEKINKLEADLRAFPQPIPAGNVEYQKVIDERQRLHLERDQVEKWPQVSNFEDTRGILNELS